jgi:hypothetical protein
LFISLIIGLILILNLNKVSVLSDKEALVEQFLFHTDNQSGYEILVNADYSHSIEPEYPQSLSDISAKYYLLRELMSLFQSGANVTLIDFINFLNKMGLTVDEEQAQFSLEASKKNSIVNVYTNKRGYIYIALTDDKLVKAVLIDSWQIMDNYMPDNQIDGFLKNYEDIEGLAQITLIDHPYNEAKIDAYFDKGIGIVNDYIILFQPTSVVDESLLISIDLYYLRPSIGCIYCEFVEY